MKKLLAIALCVASFAVHAGCKGYDGPGGACYDGPGGGLYTGPGGGAYTGPGGGAYTGPGGGLYTGPGGGRYDGPRSQGDYWSKNPWNNCITHAAGEKWVRKNCQREFW